MPRPEAVYAAFITLITIVGVGVIYIWAVMKGGL